MFEVFVEGSIPEEGTMIGRTRGDAPQVDGYIFFHSERDLMTGDLVRVRASSASQYDLQGDLI